MALLLQLGSIVVHNVGRASAGAERVWLVLVPALLLLLMCLAAVGVIFQSGGAVSGRPPYNSVQPDLASFHQGHARKSLPCLCLNSATRLKDRRTTRLTSRH